MAILYCRSLATFALLSLAIAACSGGNDDLNLDNKSDSGAGGGGSGSGGSGTGGGGGMGIGGTDAGGAGDASGPQFYIHVVTTEEEFPHADGFSGQTSRATKQGVRSFSLYRQKDDPSPVLIFDHGSGFVEAGYNAGDDTVVGSAPVSAVPAGQYTFARFGVTHSRFRVDSTLHYQGVPIPGEFDCVQVLSDDTTIDGVVRSRGWYRYIFETGGNSYPQEGAEAPLPSSPTTGGFTMVTLGNQTYYDFPITLAVPAGLDHDLHTGLRVNMHKSFRWEDQDLPGYTVGVYDTTPLSYEPVRRYGANSAELIVLNPE